MKRSAPRTAALVLLLGAAIVWMAPRPLGQSATATPFVASTKNGEWPSYTGDTRGTPLLAARSDQRAELQRPRSRLALQDRQPRHAPRIQARRHAARGRRRALRDRRHAPIGHRARRRDRRADVGAPLSRRRRAARTRRGSCRAAAWRTGPTAGNDQRILYVTPGYRLIALDAKTGQPVTTFGKDGVVDLKVGVVVRRRQADRSRDRGDRPALDADRRQGRRARRIRDEGRA